MRSASQRLNTLVTVASTAAAGGSDRDQNVDQPARIRARGGIAGPSAARRRQRSMRSRPLRSAARKLSSIAAEVSACAAIDDRARR